MISWFDAWRRRLDRRNQARSNSPVEVATQLADEGLPPFQMLWQTAPQSELAEALKEGLSSPSAESADAHRLMVRMALELAQGKQALSSSSRLVEVAPNATSFALRARALYMNGQRKPAEAAAAHARQLDAEDPDLAVHLALVDWALGRHEGAIARISSISEARAEVSAEAAFHLGNWLRELGQHPAALQAYRRSLALRPGAADTHCNLGGLLSELGQLDQAVTHLREAVRLRPAFALAQHNLGCALLDQRQYAAASTALSAALHSSPRLGDSGRLLGHAYMGLGLAGQARQAYQAAIEQAAGDVAARWGLAMSELDPLGALDESAELAKFQDHLVRLRRWIDTRQPIQAPEAVGSTQPYYLAYREGDHRPILETYGQLCSSVMERWACKVGVPKRARRTRAGRCRIGIASAHISDHSVWNALVRGWVEKLDRQRFDLHLFHLGSEFDSQSQWARGKASHWVHGSRPWWEWAKVISDAELDVLIYPEIGMDAVTARLAATRLAPVQVCSWGHPITSGLPTQDFFLSAAALEPPNGQEHYSEALVRLPGIGCHFQPSAVNPDTAGARSLLEGLTGPNFLCPGMPFKYTPKHDDVWVETARTCGPDSCLLFFAPRENALATQLQQRLRLAFEAEDLDFERQVRFLPWQKPSTFFGLMKEVVAVLDSPGFSGFNTTAQALQCGTPVLAWEGGQMRGRLASGLLGELHGQEWIARDPQGFANLAHVLASDPVARRRAQAVAGQFELICRDQRPVQALSDWLEHTAYSS